MFTDGCLFIRGENLKKVWLLAVLASLLWVSPAHAVMPTMTSDYCDKTTKLSIRDSMTDRQYVVTVTPTVVTKNGESVITKVTVRATGFGWVLRKVTGGVTVSGMRDSFTKSYRLTKDNPKAELNISPGVSMSAGSVIELVGAKFVRRGPLKDRFRDSTCLR